MTNHESEDIRAVLISLKQGGQDSLSKLFSEHRERLRRMVEFRLDARLRGRVSPSDVLQEAYIDALKRLPHFEANPEVPFFIWLRTVTIQRLIDVHRQHLGPVRNAAKEVVMAPVGGFEASSEKIAEFMGDFTSPSQAAQRGEAMAMLRQSLEQLDPIDREVLALRHFEDLSNLEVAALLDIQPSAASKRYIRALDRLKTALQRLTEFRETDS